MRDQKGVTLTDMIVVIAIIAILIMIAFPNFTGYVIHARLTSDQENINILNRITQIYKIKHYEDDAFADESKSSDYLMELLVADGMIDKKLEPLTKSATFGWVHEEEEWHLMFEDSFYVIGLTDGLTLGTGGQSGWLKGRYTGSNKDIMIPVTIDGKVLFNIWQDTFKNTGLIGVEFASDSQIKIINARAFMNNSISDLKLPASLERIDVRAFKDNHLTTITIPPKVTTIQDSAFDGNQLTEITIGPSVTTIQKNAFGPTTEQFKKAYQTNGAGTYQWNGSNWIKK